MTVRARRFMPRASPLQENEDAISHGTTYEDAISQGSAPVDARPPRHFFYFFKVFEQKENDAPDCL